MEENSCGSHGHCLQKAGRKTKEFASMFDHFYIFSSVAYDIKHGCLILKKRKRKEKSLPRL